jgi:chromosome segregation ATPase
MSVIKLATKTIRDLSAVNKIVRSQRDQAVEALKSHIELDGKSSDEMVGLKAQNAELFTTIEQLQAQLMAAKEAPAELEAQLLESQMSIDTQKEALLAEQEKSRLFSIETVSAKEAAAEAVVKFDTLQAEVEAEEAELMAAIEESKAELGDSEDAPTA